MKAIVIHAYGDNSVIQLVETNKPQIEANEILVKVHAAGVNPVDWKIRGGAGQRMGLMLPVYLGGEIAGTIAEVGQSVTGFNVGDAVYGIIKSGGFAEYAVAKANEVAAMPATVDFVQAAAIPLGALTAWQAMFDVAGLQAGQRLLITNSAGGVGSLAVQLAKAKGAHVTAMASGRNEEFVKSLGADAFIDYTKQSFEDVAHDMDVVFDTVGGDTYQKAFKTLKKGGYLVTAVAFVKEEDQQHGVGTSRVFCTPNAKQLAAITELVEAGKLHPTIDTVLPLEDVRRAFEQSEAGRTRGKIVLQVAM